MTPHITLSVAAVWALALVAPFPTEAGGRCISQAPRDGVTPAWPCLQGEIDALSRSGGGVLVLPKGAYLTARLELKSDVVLRLERGATVLASTNRQDYGCDGGPHRRLSVIGACGARNIGIEGEGRIDGRGGMYSRHDDGPDRWRSLHLVDCSDVRLEGVSFVDSNYWTVFLQRCDGVVVRHVTIRSQTNFNNDGLDLEVRNAVVEDCDIDSDDDAICFKSHSPGFAVENVAVARCRLSSHCNFIKFGTASFGVFRNVSVRDCELVTRTTGLRDWTTRDMGVPDRTWGISGIALEVVDGGGVENVVVDGVKLNGGVMNPVFIRLGTRHESSVRGRPFLRNVTIANVTSVSNAYSLLPIFISGVKDARISDVVLRNVDVAFKAQGRLTDLAVEVPELERAYPEIHLFGDRFPSYGAFVRHADRVRFENVTYRTVGGTEVRPCVKTDDVTDFEATDGDVVLAADYGVVADVAELQTSRIQAAIDAAGAIGSGVVRLPRGRVASGALFLRGGVTLEIPEGSVLAGSSDWRDYGDGGRVNALLSAVGVSHVGIRGAGLIDGVDVECPKGEEGFRGPHVFFAKNASAMRIEGVQVERAGNYAFLCRNCSDIAVTGVKVRGGHDGVHLQACEHARIVDCDFRTGDDCVAGTDNRHVVVSNCYFNSSCNAFRFGVADFVVSDCAFKGPGEHPHRISVKRGHPRTSMGAAFVHFSPTDRNPVLPSDNWTIQRCRIDNVGSVYSYDHEKGLWQTGQPALRLRFADIHATNVRNPIRAVGDGELDLTLENVSVGLAASDVPRPALDVRKFHALRLGGLSLDNGTETAPVAEIRDGDLVEWLGTGDERLPVGRYKLSGIREERERKNENRTE